MINPGIKAVLYVVILFILVMGSGCSYFRQAPREDDSGAISFSLPDLFSGEKLSFPDDFQDQIVYLVYFANG